MKIVHFGAGNIGRSLVGSLFSNAGWDVVFVDMQHKIINALNERGTYNVIHKGELRDDEVRSLTVKNVRGVFASDKGKVNAEIADCNLISTAVGANAIPHVLRAIAEGIAGRSDAVTILFCENLHGVATTAKEVLGTIFPADFDIDKRIGFSETSIGKMVPIMPLNVSDPLEVWAEPYNRIIADKEGFVGGVPQVDGLDLYNNFSAYVDRKLFVHNFGHATAAWHGFIREKDFIWQCLENKQILAEVEGVMRESAQALTATYGDIYEDEPLESYISNLLFRFKNKELGDTVYRVGRDLKRKLSASDRALGALNLALKNNTSYTHMLKSIVAATQFRAVDERGQMFPGDKELTDYARDFGVTKALAEYANIEIPLCLTRKFL